MPTVMGHSFSAQPKAEIPRSVFDRSHGVKTTFDADYLIPFYVDEALPGDTFQLKVTAMARVLSALQRPIMDNMYMDFFYFACPYRLVWTNFPKFMGEQANPGDSTSYLVPTFVGISALSSLHDYMGVPTTAGNVTWNSLHARAYNLIYREWFRDQNLINSPVVDLDDGPDTVSDYVLRKRGKRPDYFASCLPWPQKGTAVALPLGTRAEVQHDQVDASPLAVYSTVNSALRSLDSSGANLAAGVGAGSSIQALYANLSTATAATINQLRQAFATQKLLERDARGGTRYIEIIKSHFGVTSPDARLQRPELLGTGSTPVSVSEVAQTSNSGSPTLLGNLGATGRAVSTNNGFIKSFTEHTLLIGIVCVRADLTYSQGLDRMFSRQTRLDFYWPALSHIGEQAVISKEIYMSSTTVDDNTVFGYIPRYDEYRFKKSQLTSLMRVDAAGSLSVWHLSQDFSARPTLNQTFIEQDTPLDRVVAVPSEPHFIFDAFLDLKCARPMPMFSVPGFIDRF